MTTMRIAGHDAFSPMLGVCASPGCSTLVFGQGTCLEHTPPQTMVFVVGRPFRRAQVDASVPDRLLEAARASFETS
jgi:hypothetical protein